MHFEIGNPLRHRRPDRLLNRMLNWLLDVGLTWLRRDQLVANRAVDDVGD
jgi:hypothetical protein